MQVPRSGPPERRQRAGDRGQRAGVEMAGAHQPGAEPAIAAFRRLRRVGSFSQQLLVHPVPGHGGVPGGGGSPDAAELEPAGPVPVPQVVEQGDPARRHHPRAAAQGVHVPVVGPPPPPAAAEAAVLQVALPDGLRRQER